MVSNGWLENMSWRRHQMETFSALLVLREGNSSVTVGIQSQRPVARSFLVFVDLRLNKNLSKQSEMPVIWDAIAFIMTSLSCTLSKPNYCVISVFRYPARRLAMFMRPCCGAQFVCINDACRTGNKHNNVTEYLCCTGTHFNNAFLIVTQSYRYVIECSLLQQRFIASIPLHIHVCVDATRRRAFTDIWIKANRNFHQIKITMAKILMKSTTNTSWIQRNNTQKCIQFAADNGQGRQHVSLGNHDGICLVWDQISCRRKLTDSKDAKGIETNSMQRHTQLRDGIVYSLCSEVSG